VVATAVNNSPCRQRLTNRAFVRVGHAGSVNPIGDLTRRLVYQAGRTRGDLPPTTYELDRDGTVVRGWVTRPGSARAVVYFGGNIEDVSGWRPRFGTSLGGRTSYLVAYRGHGASDGIPTERDLVEDGIAVLLDVAGRHESVAVIGRSLGSGVAAQVCSDARVRDVVESVVMVTPFDSLSGVMRTLFGGLPVDLLVPDRFSSVEHVGDIAAPILVVRAGHDTIVRPEATDRLVAALPPGARVVELPEEDHVSVAQPDAYWNEVQRFLGEPVT